MRSRRSTLSRLALPDEDDSVDSTPKATDPAPFDRTPARYTIAVIGDNQTGKTALINRAFKPYGVTEPVELAVGPDQIGELQDHEAAGADD